MKSMSKLRRRTGSSRWFLHGLEDGGVQRLDDGAGRACRLVAAGRCSPQHEARAEGEARAQGREQGSRPGESDGSIGHLLDPAP
jgi:hypothetical protein